MEQYEDKIDYTTVITYAFTQYSLKRGLKKLKGKGKMAVTEYMSQLHTRDIFRPKSAKHLTKEQEGDALEHVFKG